MRILILNQNSLFTKVHNEGLRFKEARSLLDKSPNEGIEQFESGMREGGFEPP